MREWTSWAQSIEKNGITNKAAFAAKKIRNGFAVGDVFPIFIERDLCGNEQTQLNARKAEVDDLAEEKLRERTRHADSLIASLDNSRRQDLRDRALRDTAAWLGRDTSADVFDRLVLSIERRLVVTADSSS